MPRWRALLFLAFAVAPSSAAAEWRRLESPNFIVIGDASERELRNIAVHFEGFRETLGRVLSAKVTATAVPTVVVVFPHDRAYTPYKPVFKGKPVDVGGVFYAGRDMNYITLLSDVTEGRLRVLFHEYTHLMVSNVVRNLPTWLSEGLAEYYSTYDHLREGREATIGRPIESHLARLGEGRLLPLSELIAVDHSSPLYNEGERRSVFYAQSWALTHMLLLGEPSRVKELSAFMGALQNGASTADAWRQAFGAVDLDRELQQYIRAFAFRMYKFKFDEAIARVNASARPMAPSEVSAFLGGLRIRQERVDEAATLVDAALKVESTHPHANVAKAQVDLARGEREAAAARLTTMTPANDWFVSYSAGTTLTDSIESGSNVPVDRSDAARAHFAALARDRELANALADTVRLDIAGSRTATADTRKTIERARALAPGRDDYAFLHARVLTELGEFALARAVLGPMMTPSSPPHVRSNATNLMNYIVQLEARRRAVEASRGSSSNAERPTKSTPETRDEVSRSRPAFRTVAAGEQRLEGTLERISCPAGAAVSFSVRSAAGVETFQAAKFESVDFISYRDDLTGNITCGPIKEPQRVYLTWRPGAGNVRTAVAIEFLPK